MAEENELIIEVTIGTPLDSTQFDISRISGLLPQGGTENQYLVKTSSVDYEAEWRDFPEITGGGNGGNVNIDEERLVPTEHTIGQFLSFTANGVEFVNLPIPTEIDSDRLLPDGTVGQFLSFTADGYEFVSLPEAMTVDVNRLLPETSTIGQFLSFTANGYEFVNLPEAVEIADERLVPTVHTVGQVLTFTSNGVEFTDLPEAETIDDNRLIPPLGVANQILAKVSDNSYDVHWINQPEAGTSLEGVSANWQGVHDSVINVPDAYTLIDTSYDLTDDIDDFDYQFILETEKGKFISQVISGTQLNTIATETAGFVIVNSDGDVITNSAGNYLNVQLNASAFSQLRGINSIILAKDANNNLLLTSANGALENIRLIIERKNYSLIGPEGMRGLPGESSDSEPFDPETLDFSNLLEMDRTELAAIPNATFNITNESNYVSNGRSFSQASGFTINLSDNVEKVFGSDNILHLNIAVAVGSTTYRPSLLINAVQNNIALEVIGGSRRNLETGENYEILIRLIDDSDISVELIAQVLSVTVRPNHLETRNVALSAFIISEGDLFDSFNRLADNKVDALRGELTNADSITQETINSFNEQLADITHITNFLTVIEGSGRVSANFLVDAVPAVNGSYTVSSAEQVSIYVPTDTQRQFVLLNGTDEVRLDYQRTVVINDVRYSVTYPINFAAGSVLTATISANTSTLMIIDEVNAIQDTLVHLLDPVNAKLARLGDNDNLDKLAAIANHVTIVNPTDGVYTTKDEYELGALAFNGVSNTDSNFNIISDDVSITLEGNAVYNEPNNEAHFGNINIASDDIVGLYDSTGLQKPLILGFRYSYLDNSQLLNETQLVSFDDKQSLISIHSVFGVYLRQAIQPNTQTLAVNESWHILGMPEQVIQYHNPQNSNLPFIFNEPSFELNSRADVVVTLNTHRGNTLDNLGSVIESRTFNLTIDPDGSLSAANTVFSGLTYFDGTRNQTIDYTLSFETTQLDANGLHLRTLQIRPSPSISSLSEDVGLFSISVHQEERVSVETPSGYRNITLPLNVGSGNDVVIALVPSFPTATNEARQLVDLLVSSSTLGNARRYRTNRTIGDIMNVTNTSLDVNIDATYFGISNVAMVVSKTLIDEANLAAISPNTVESLFNLPVPTPQSIDYQDISDWAYKGNTDVIPSSKIQVQSVPEQNAVASPWVRLDTQTINVVGSGRLHSTGVMIPYLEADQYTWQIETITNGLVHAGSQIQGNRIANLSVGVVGEGYSQDTNARVLTHALVDRRHDGVESNDSLRFQRTLEDSEGNVELLVANIADTPLTTILVVSRRLLQAAGRDGVDGMSIKGDPGEDSTVPGPGVAEGGTTSQILAKKSDDNFDTEWIDQPTGGGSSGTPTRVALSDTSQYYSHLGVPDLTATVDNSGVLGLVRMSNGTYEATTSHAAGDTPTLFKLVFDNTTGPSNVPDAWQYNDNTHPVVAERGHLILPAGQYIFCASLNLRSVGFSGNAARQVATMYITQGTANGGNDRHGNTVYLRNSNMRSQVYDDMMGVMSVTGAVVSDGSTPIFIKLAVANQSGVSNPFELHGAHLHIIQQLI